jgi:hypothetical protein
LDPAPEAVAAAFCAVTEPLRAPAEDWQVTDAEAALAGERLAALPDATFDAVVAAMAGTLGGRYLRRLITETEEEKASVPEAIRAFVARVAARATPATARMAVLSLGRHALGRFLEALGQVPRADARRLLRAAGGPDAVAALAVEETLRAVADGNDRALRSLSAGLAGLAATWPPGVETIRAVAAHMARRIHEWPAGPCERLVAALERGAALDHALPGYVPDTAGLPAPFGGDDAFAARLYEDLLERRPRLGRVARPGP